MKRRWMDRVGAASAALGAILAVPAAAQPHGAMAFGCPMPGMQQMMNAGMMSRGMMGHGMMAGRRMMMGRHAIGSGAMNRVNGTGSGMQSNMADMGQIHALLANHKTIQRRVQNLPNGVETITTSSDARVAALLPEHVTAMYARLKDGRLIRGFDPLFVELFRSAGKIDLKMERLKNGVRVVETSRDPHAVKLIQAHAEAVNGFARDGLAAMHRRHPAPAAK